MSDLSSWPFDDPPDLGVFVTVDLVDGTERPLLIEHDPDGDWLISGRLELTTENLVLVHLGWAAEAFAEVREHASLARGRGVSRDPESGLWTEHDVVLTD